MRALSHRSGLMSYLWAVQVRLTEFAEHVVKLTEQLKDASLSLARQIGRPVQYLTSAASNKEDIARRIAARDHIDHGLICVLTAVEPCWSFGIVRDRTSKRIEAEPRYRKCLHLYHAWRMAYEPHRINSVFCVHRRSASALKRFLALACHDAGNARREDMRSRSVRACL